MKIIISLLSVLLVTLPAFSQTVPVGKVARGLERAHRNAQRFHTASLMTPSKQILNLQFRYKREYNKAVLLYQKIQLAPTGSYKNLAMDIQNGIVNNTLRNILLENLQRENFASMQQDMEAYFHLTPQLPIFANSAAPAESFAYTAAGYLRRHPHKPSWRLREIISFGDMKHVKSDWEETLSNPERALSSPENFPPQEEAVLTGLYQQAEEINGKIKDFIAKPQLTSTEHEEMVTLLRQAYLLYEELIQFAKNAPAVRETVEIYTQLTNEVEAFMKENHRAPEWKNPDERELANLFPVLVFQNRANEFEEMIPIMKKLYELTEKYPACRLSQRETLHFVKEFLKKHYHMPRSVRMRDFFDTKPDEAMLFEAMLYWQNASPEFNEKLLRLQTVQPEDLPPAF